MRGTRIESSSHMLSERFIPAYAGNTELASMSSKVLAVHPRVCGEHRRFPSTMAHTCGSSPRMRGTRFGISAGTPSRRFIPAYAGNTGFCRFHYQQDYGSSPRMRGTLIVFAARIRRSRFIPAYAGNTLICRKYSVPNTVHPRVCGEHICSFIRHTCSDGSSPRMRGTPAAFSDRRVNERFIPAYAGNTPRQLPDSEQYSVHPRVCGEHLPSPFQLLCPPGSSPRMRGTRTPLIQSDWKGRFIPAYAGNTPSQGTGTITVPVHPRVCGEHSPFQADRVSVAGSSPRMRGTRQGGNEILERGRFIPAYAGNTSFSRFRAEFPAVHPRVCGEHAAIWHPNDWDDGSSPRMRGTRRKLLVNRNSNRFIPAYAGNTLSIRGTLLISPVHPRVCGEHPAEREARSRTSGSSPRMRGTLPQEDREMSVRRFIPAYAGNTSIIRS